MIRRKDSKLKRLRRRADALWQRCIVGTWHGHCARCQSTWQVAGHHLVPRRFQATRHDLMNGVCLCGTCHVWADEHPVAFLEWIRVAYPHRYAWLQANKHPDMFRSTEERLQARVERLLEYMEETK